MEEVTEFVQLKNKGKDQNKISEELKNLTVSMETEIFQWAQEIQKTTMIRLGSTKN